MSTHRGRERAFLALKLLFLVGAVWFLLTKIRLADLKNSASEVGLLTLLIAVAIESSGHFLDSLRQKIWLRNERPKVKFLSFVRARYLSSFLGNFLPSAFFSDAVRASFLTKEIGLGPESWASTVMVRVVGLLVTFCIMVTGVTLGFAGVPDSSLSFRFLFVISVIFFSLIAFFLCLNASFIGWIEKKLGQFVPVRYAKVTQSLVRFLVMLGRYRSDVSGLVSVFLVSVVYQLTTVVMVAWICHSVHVPVEPFKLLFQIPLISLLVMVPASINGIGIQDASWIYLMGSSGVSVDKLLVISLVWHFARIAGTLPGGLVLLQFKKKNSQT